MDFWFVLLVVFALIILGAIGKTKKELEETRKKEDRRAAKEKRRESIEAHPPSKTPVPMSAPVWLKERWALSEELKGKRGQTAFPKWYYDEPTDFQREKLADLGIVGPMTANKGRLSDLIGLHCEADHNSLEVLKFFKQPLEGLSQTEARHKGALLLQDPEHAKLWTAHQKAIKESWDNRPAESNQKNWLKFFNMAVPKGLSYKEAQKLIEDAEEKLEEAHDPRLTEWYDLQERLENEVFVMEEFLEAFDELEGREIWEIKKPSKKLIKKAVEELKAEGMSHEDIQDDFDKLVDKLVQLKPDLRRST